MNNKPVKPVLAIVVPCYNEQEVLPETTDNLYRAIRSAILCMG